MGKSGGRALNGYNNKQDTDLLLKKKEKILHRNSKLSISYLQQTKA
jgi:hypothetical protein